MIDQCGRASGKGGHLAEAAEWCVRLTEANLRTTPEFELWLQQQENAAAWNQVSVLWNFVGDMAHEPEMVAAREAALGDAKRANITRVRTIPVGRLTVAAAAVLVIGALAWGGHVWVNRPDDYQTATGERRMITLSDGSKLSLDANSEVIVRYAKNARTLHLLRGQARFDVAHDKKRPFSVAAGNQEVIATGTSFNIDMAGPKVLVTLIEGHVIVLNKGNDSEAMPASTGWPKSVELRAGQQLAAVPSAPPAVASANIQQVTAWTSGQVMADNEPLSSVVARINRYGSTTIVINDPQVAALKISGVFNAGDVAGFIEIVTHYLPVRAIPESQNTISLQGEVKKGGTL